MNKYANAPNTQYWEKLRNREISAKEARGVQNTAKQNLKTNTIWLVLSALILVVAFSTYSMWFPKIESSMPNYLPPLVRFMLFFTFGFRFFRSIVSLYCNKKVIHIIDNSYSSIDELVNQEQVAAENNPAEFPASGETIQDLIAKCGRYKRNAGFILIALGVILALLCSGFILKILQGNFTFSFFFIPFVLGAILIVMGLVLLVQPAEKVAMRKISAYCSGFPQPALVLNDIISHIPSSHCVNRDIYFSPNHILLVQSNGIEIIEAATLQWAYMAVRPPSVITKRSYSQRYLQLHRNTAKKPSLQFALASYAEAQAILRSIKAHYPHTVVGYSFVAESVFKTTPGNFSCQTVGNIDLMGVKTV